MKKIVVAMVATVAVSCSSKPAAAETQAVAPENDTETIDVPTPVVREWTSDTKIAPDATAPIVIDFNAAWCGPCRAFAPIFRTVAEKYTARAIFLSVNVDRCEQAARQFGVTAIPQVSILMPDGTVQSRMGYMPQEEFEAFLAGVIGK